MDTKSESIPLLEKWLRPSVEQRWSRDSQRGSCIAQRWVFAIMGFFAVFNAYSMRVILSIAITEMAKPINQSHIYDEDTCPPEDYGNGNSSSSNQPRGTYEWDAKQQGWILSSFYWGYVMTHLPGGILAEKYGGKYSLGLGILSTALFTLLTPAAVDAGGATALIILRVLMGCGEGTTYPALNAMLAQWTPPEERSKIGSLVFAGAQLGTVFATTISGFILHHPDLGWRVVFYTFGVLGVLWFLIWVVLCYNNPQEHPFISEREAKYLHERMSAHTSTKPGPVPWRRILTSAPLWALVAAQIGHDWGFFTMVTDLPLYMSNVLRFRIKENGILTSVPYLCMWLCSCASSWLADWMIVRQYLSTTKVRKLGTTIASIGPGLFILAASYADCNRFLVVTYFTIGMTFMGTFYPGMKVNALDLSPNYSGTLMAMTNGIAAFTGIITPYIVAAIAPHQTLTEWRIVFWIVFGVFVVTNLIFLMYGSGEVQPWNDSSNNETKEKRPNSRSGNLEVGTIGGAYSKKATTAGA